MTRSLPNLRPVVEQYAQLAQSISVVTCILRTFTGAWTPGELAVLRAAGKAWEMTRPQLAERLGLDGHPREQCEVEHAPGSRRCTHTAAIAITTGCTQGEHIGTTNACPCCARRIDADEQAGDLRCGNCDAVRVVLKAEPLHGMQDDREELIG